MSEDAHHGGGASARPAGGALAVCAPAQAPALVAWPAPTAGQACWRCGTTPWPAMMVCGCAAPPKKAEHHAPKPPPPPAFSSAVPEDFPPRFAYVWSALAKVLEGKAPPQGVIADARALLTMLLDVLDPDGRGRFVTEGVWLWKKKTFRTYDAKLRIHRLVEKGVLLKQMKAAVDQLAWTPEEEAARSMRGDPDLAKRLVHLVWQIADQGFEQSRWSAFAEAPPRVVPAAAGHGGDGHGDHH